MKANPNKKNTLVQMSKKLTAELKTHALVDRESYESIIWRLLKSEVVENENIKRGNGKRA